MRQRLESSVPETDRKQSDIGVTWPFSVGLKVLRHFGPSLYSSGQGRGVVIFLYFCAVQIIGDNQLMK